MRNIYSTLCIHFASFPTFVTRPQNSYRTKQKQSSFPGQSCGNVFSSAKVKCEIAWVQLNMRTHLVLPMSTPHVRVGVDWINREWSAPSLWITQAGQAWNTEDNCCCVQRRMRDAVFCRRGRGFNSLKQMKVFKFGQRAMLQWSWLSFRDRGCVH